VATARSQPDLRALEEALREHPALRECRLVVRGAETIAYVVPASGNVRARTAIAAAVPGARCAPLTALPRDAHGAIDDDALTRLPVIDDATALAYESRLAALPGVETAVVVDDAPARRPLLARADLVPVTLAARHHSPALATVSSPATTSSAPSSATPAFADGGPLPADLPRSLLETLITAARTAAGITVVNADGSADHRSYAALLTTADRVATGLRAAGLRAGDPVLLQCRDHHDFFAAFWGAQAVGAVPVPTAVAPNPGEPAAAQRLLDIWEMLGRPAIAADHGVAADLGALACAERVLRVADLSLGEAISPRHAADPDDVAVMMLTSGSTGLPKAVPLRHRHLIARAVGTARLLGMQTGETSLNWMALDHVAGTIKMHQREVLLAAHQVHVATDWVLQQPLRWLDLIERFRVTIAFAPNFAYGLVNQHAEAIARRGWDLSSLRWLVNGGEAVVARTARRFLELLEPHGLRTDAMRPAWGMSETSSGVTYATLTRAGSDDQDLHVEVGAPIPGVQLRVVDDAGTILAEGATGRLQVRGAAVFAGYHRNPAADAESFTTDGWFDTGDLAILRAGRLTIAGRRKDVIIINGANHSAAAIEAAAEATGLVEPSFSAAVGLADAAGLSERLVILVVPRDAGADDDALAELLAIVRTRVGREAGVVPDAVLAVGRGDIPKTSIGKIQRPQIRKRLTEGGFAVAERRSARLLPSDAAIPDWFMQRRWSPRPGRPGTPPSAVGVIGDDALAGRLGGRTLAASAAGWIPALSAAGAVDTVVVARVGEGRAGLVALLDLVQALAGLARPLRLLVVASASQWVGESDPAVDPWRAAAIGLLRSAAKDAPHLTIRHLDVVGDATAAITSELGIAEDHEEIAWRAGVRRVAMLAPVAFASGAPAALPAFVGTMCTILGGAGGIGGHLAGWLLERGARVLILGRRGEDALDGDSSARLAALRRVGDVRYQAVDVGDPAALAAAVAAGEAAWGTTLAAVFHLAGAYRPRPLASEDAAGLDAALGPKLAGVRAARAVADVRPGCWLIGFSSVAGVFGAAGEVAYAAANRALDAELANRQRELGRTLCLQWSLWEGIGMGRAATGVAAMRANGIESITFGQGLDSLAAAWSHALGEVAIGLDPGRPYVARHSVLTARPTARLRVGLVGVAALPDAVDAWGNQVPRTVLPLRALPHAADGSIDRARLAREERPRREPEQPSERLVAGIWRDLLGGTLPGMDDDFFASGGHSLAAAQLLARLRDAAGVDLATADLFADPTVAGLARLVATRTGGHARIPRRAEEGPAPLSFAQQRLWFLDRLLPGGHVFNIPARIVLPPRCDQRALRAALATLAGRHATLRTVFPAAGGKPAQSVLAAVDIPMTVVDISADADLETLAAAEARQPFDLEHGPLLRARLLVRGEAGDLLLITIHHIIADGWSMGVLFRELEACYRAGVAGASPHLAELPIQYHDYAAWQRLQLDDAALAAPLAWWREHLAGCGHGLELPTDRPRPLQRGQRGARHERRLDGARTRAVADFARAEGATPFMVLLAAYAALLRRHARSDDVVLGTVVANRDRVELEPLVGFFVNLLVVRLDLAGAPSFRDALARTKRSALDAFAHQEVPFEMLVDRLQPARRLSHAPFFQIAFDLRDRTSAHHGDGFRAAVCDADLGTAMYDLHLTLDPDGDGLRAIWEYDRDLFDPATIARLAGQFETLLASAVAAPERGLDDLDLLDGDEYELVTRTWNAATVPIPATSVPELVRARALATPAAIAVEAADVSLSYVDLETRVAALAAWLARRGVATDDRVAICVDRSPLMVVAMLGVLRAGAAYVPLDPAYPDERLAFQFADCGARVLLTQTHLLGRVPAGDAAVALDAIWEAIAASTPTAPVAITPNSLAYVIYTSGSTGRPKGVQIEHRGLSHLVAAQAAAYPIDAQTRAVQFAAAGFDASVWEIFSTLVAGGTVVLGTRDDYVPGPALVRFLRERRITIATLVPSVLSALPEGELPDLATLVSAGEACSAELARRWSRGRRFLNAYGPTEVTVCATIGAVDGGDGRAPDIGRPLANARVYVLDAQRRPVAIGVVGELYLGGAGVARGYLGRAELTAERFLADPFADEPGARMFRTGDLGRWRADGTIEFLGRIDHQVKLRGFRIELGEIEAVLAAHPAVAAAIVLVREDRPGDRRLAAYVVASATQVTSAQIKEHLAKRLPEHMVPSDVVLLDRLPVTANGKVDRAALPAPVSGAAAASGVTPAAGLEATIAAVWAQVLGCERVAADANFFDLGGHSLSMAQVQAQLGERIGRPVPIVDLFAYPTVAALARHLGGAMVPNAAPDRQAVANRQAQGRERLAELARRQRSKA